jgi:hypothetical protein
MILAVKPVPEIGGLMGGARADFEGEDWVICYPSW